MDWVTALVDDIDAGRLRPRSHVVARRLVEHEGLTDPLALEIVHAFDTGEPVPNEHLLEKLWSKIDETELPQQGSFRTLVGLLQPDVIVDGYYADYLIGWAQDEGVTPDSIDSAFRRAG